MQLCYLTCSCRFGTHCPPLFFCCECLAGDPSCDISTSTNHSLSKPIRYQCILRVTIATSLDRSVIACVDVQSNATSTGVRAVFLWTVTDTCLYLHWMHTAVPQVACIFKKVLQDSGYSHLNISIYGISNLDYSTVIKVKRSTVRHNSPILWASALSVASCGLQQPV